MTIGSINRGAVRASCFDANIAARRLENIANAPNDMKFDTRERMKTAAKKLREAANEIRSLLSPAEQADLEQIFS